MNRGARGGGNAPPPDFPRFNTVGIDLALKPIKVFKYCPPVFVPSSGTDMYCLKYFFDNKYFFSFQHTCKKNPHIKSQDSTDSPNMNGRRQRHYSLSRTQSVRETSEIERPLRALSRQNSFSDRSYLRRR